MNKLTKVGLSALCGSLASISAANAGTLEVLGGATATWSSNSGKETGNPIGMNSGMTFKGSGELDNGSTFTLTVTGADQAAYTSGSVALTTPSMGVITFVHAAGGAGVDRYDDMMPTAWEETNGTSLATGLQTVAGAGTTMNVEWNLPADILPDGMTAQLTYAPRMGAGIVNDKAASGDTGLSGSGYDITLSLAGDTLGVPGLTLDLGMASIEQDSSKGGFDGDQDESTYAITYAAGGFTVGYQYSEEDLGRSASEQEYENTGYDITFNVNDDLSVGYNHYESEQTSTTNVTTEATSVQVAYSMGGASVRLAVGDVDNGSYQTTPDQDKEVTTLSVSLAF